MEQNCGVQGAAKSCQICSGYQIGLPENEKKDELFKGMGFNFSFRQKLGW
jgi:hypothetical protein